MTLLKKNTCFYTRKAPKNWFVQEILTFEKCCQDMIWRGKRSKKLFKHKRSAPKNLLKQVILTFGKYLDILQRAKHVEKNFSILEKITLLNKFFQTCYYARSAQKNPLIQEILTFGKHQDTIQRTKRAKIFFSLIEKKMALLKKTCFYTRKAPKNWLISQPLESATLCLI